MPRTLLRAGLVIAGVLALAGALAAAAPEANAAAPSNPTLFARVTMVLAETIARSSPSLLLALVAFLIAVYWRGRHEQPATPRSSFGAPSPRTPLVDFRAARPGAHSDKAGPRPALLHARGASPRLARLDVTAPLTEVSQLLDRIVTNAEPLAHLAEEHDRIEARFQENLERALGPLIEYAEREQENLQTLIQSSDDSLDGLPAGTVDIVRQHERAEAIRADGRRQEAILGSQFEVERRALDAALSAFDADLALLNSQLLDARRTAERVADSLRSAAFERTVDFLRRRVEYLDETAAAGASTIDWRAAALGRAAIPAPTIEDPYLTRVLAALDVAAPVAPGATRAA